MRNVFLVIVISLIYLLAPALQAQCGTCSTCCSGDMLFGLDASGSMQMVLNPDPAESWNHPTNLMSSPNHPCTRWSHVKAALLDVLSELSVFIQNAEDWFDSSNCPRCGWVGIVQFPAKSKTSTSFSELHMCPVQMPSSAADKEKFFYHTNPAMSPVLSQVESFVPRVGIPGTPMAHGLETSRGQFPGFPPPGFPVSGPACAGTILNHPPHKHGIFLFSDGENNVGGPITTSWATAFAAATPATHDMKVYSIGFGDFPSVAVDALYSVAVATGGTFRYLSPVGYTQPINPDTGSPCPSGSSNPAVGIGHNAIPDLSQLFKQQIIDEYWGITSMVDPVFTLNADETKTFLLCTNELDSTIMVVINTAPYPEARMPSVSIQVPGGLNVNPTNALGLPGVKYASQHRAHDFTFTRSFIESNLGEWQVAITALDSGTYDFHAFVKSGLGFQLRNTNPTVGTGERIHFEMTFNPGAVDVDSFLVNLSLERPPIGVGNLFQQHQLTEEQTENALAQRQNPDSSPAYWKKLYLNQQGLAPPPVRDSIIVVFNDLGKKGDKTAGDGIYSWQTDVIGVPDVYKFSFDIRGPLSSSGEFCRAKVIHNYVFIKVEPEWGSSTIEFIPDGQVMDEQVFGHLIIRLADSLGNAVEAQLASYFDIQITNGNPIEQLEYDLDGAYVQKMSYQQDTQPIVDLAYRDRDFPPYPIPIPVKPAMPWTVSGYYGLSYPFGDFKQLNKSGATTVNIDFGYHFPNSPLGMSLSGGMNRFKSRTLNSNNDLVRLNLVVHYLLWNNRWIQPFVNAGPGYYSQELADNGFGATIGLGTSIHLTPSISVDAVSSLHYIFADENNLFNQTNLGFRIHF